LTRVKGSLERFTGWLTYEDAKAAFARTLLAIAFSNLLGPCWQARRLAAQVWELARHAEAKARLARFAFVGVLAFLVFWGVARRAPACVVSTPLRLGSKRTNVAKSPCSA
jgi:hypothetical protein